MHVLVCPQGVERVLRSSFAVASEIGYYAIADLDDTRYAFVPAKLPPQCKGFYCAHSENHATHVLVWPEDHPVLLQIEPLTGGTEITFDYGAHYRAVARDKSDVDAVARAQEQDTELALSLSSASSDSQLTGWGQVVHIISPPGPPRPALTHIQPPPQVTERTKNSTLAERVAHAAQTHGADTDLHPLFGFGATPP